MKTGDGKHYAGFGKVIRQRFRVTWFSGVADISTWSDYDVSDKRQLVPIIKEFLRLNPDFSARRVTVVYKGLAI